MARILVAEDNSDVRELIAHLLRSQGHSIQPAANGAEALALAEQDPPDLVVMDLAMPIFDGWAATRQLKADPRTAHIPVIVLTAHILPEDEFQARAAGCDSFMEKPFGIDYFLSQVTALVAKRRAVGGTETGE
jgi:CheY-like chemotaxis protein